MRKWWKWCCPALGVAALLVLSMTGTFGAQDTVAEKHDVRDLNQSLKDVINAGAEMFNRYGDHHGCYRLYQGALMSVKPFLTPALQKDIEEGIAGAERMARASDRAFALRKVIDNVRSHAQAAAKGPKDKIPPPKDKVDDKPPKDKKDKKPPPPKDKFDDKPPPPKDKKFDDKPPPPKDKKFDDKPPPPKDKKDDAKAKTLWNRLGGEAKVRKVVDDFFDAAGPDPKVNVSRDGKFKLDEDGVKHAKHQLVTFLSSVTGGPLKYDGRNMKDAHRGMGITNSEYNAAGKHFRNALEKNGAGKEEAAELMAAFESLRKDIVEAPSKKKDDKKKTDDKKKDEPKKADDKKKEEPKKIDDKKKDDVKKVDQPKKVEDKVKASLEPAKLSGKVTYKGQPASAAYITFVSEDNRRYSTYIHEDGAYSFRTPIPTGRYRVGIERAPGEAAKSDIPGRYRDSKTSGLSLEVRTGNQVFDVVLD